MEIDEMIAWIRVQNLCISGLIVTEEEQLTKINLGSKKKPIIGKNKYWFETC
jgi:hypothetical protein